MTAALRAVVVQGRRQGSGVILNRRLVLTSAHVISDAPRADAEAPPRPDAGPAPGPDAPPPPDHTAPPPGQRHTARPEHRHTASPEAARAVPPSGRAVPPADRTVRPAAGTHASAQPAATVVHPTAGSVPCSLAWIDHAADAAVLYAHADLPFTTHVRVGRLDTDQPLPDCQVVGFPAIQRDRAGRLATDQLTCTVLPAAGRPGTVLTVEFDRPPAEEQPAAASPLAGLSGAPVFAGEVLLGIVTRVPQGRLGLRAEGVAVVRLAELPYDLPDGEPITRHVPMDVPYEAEYAAAVKAAYRRTKLFGLDDLSRRQAEWDLDVAYLSLEAEAGHTALTPGTSATTGRAAPDFTSGTRSTRIRRDARAPQRIDTLLSSRPRVLLRGEAGAGKTTLVWWLAAHAADGTLGPRLAELNGLVPFVVPLRSVHAQDGSFPSPAELPYAAGLAVDRAPEGWASRVLRSGRALLLVDGLDEVPQADREDVHDWLAALLRRFPGTRCVATVRPLAVEPWWLASEDFEELRLLPMRDEDIQAFVASWHRAALLDGDDPGHLHELEIELLRQFRQNPILRDLARSPLLCAVICALHHKQDGFLPETRFQLYESALRMLLGKRDQRRRVGRPDGIDMSVEEHHQILQRFAAWLVRCGQSEFTADQVAPHLAGALAGMARVREQGGADDVLTHLLNRSGLLQERSDGTYQFIHRTFQDFLAAKEFVEGGYLGELVRNAADEQWRDVILLAAGHCRRELRTLLVGLLERAEAPGTSADLRAELHVLAARCAQHAAWLEEDVAARIRRSVAVLVPPADAAQVQRLVRLGPYVLPLLPEPGDQPLVDAVRTVQVICGIGGSDAVPHARRWTRHSSTAANVLTSAWDNFPTEEYARDVLTAADLTSTTVRVTSAQQLAQLRRFGRCRSLVLSGDFSARQIAAVLPLVRDLLVQRNTALTDLGFVRARRGASAAPDEGLGRLEVSGCPHLDDLSALASSTALHTLTLDAHHLRTSALAPLAAVPGLHSLRLDNLTTDRMAQLPVHPGVRRLRLSALQEFDLDGLQAWTSVEDLTVHAPADLTAALLARLRDAPRITAAETGMPSLSRLLDEPAVPRITSLVVRRVADWSHLSALPHVFPGLSALSLHLAPRDAPALLDLSPLHTLPNLDLRVHGITGREVRVVGGEPYGIEDGPRPGGPGAWPGGGGQT